jgi:hypothetical protein
VGPIFYPKNKIDDTNYNELVRIARLNEWSEVLKNSDDKLLYNKYITELNTMSGSDDELNRTLPRHKVMDNIFYVWCIYMIIN